MNSFPAAFDFGRYGNDNGTMGQNGTRWLSQAMGAVISAPIALMLVAGTAWILLVLYVQNTVLSMIGTYIYF